MSESPLAGGSAGGAGPEPSGPGLVAHVESYEDAPDECTLYPVGLDGDELVTSWISARTGSFVELTAMR